MSEEKSTHKSLGAGEYRRAAQVTTTDASQPTTGVSQDRRVVSSSRTTDSLKVRITTRTVPERGSTE